MLPVLTDISGKRRHAMAVDLSVLAALLITPGIVRYDFPEKPIKIVDDALQHPGEPIILGMVLGNIAETNFIRAIMMGGWTVFFTRPLSLGMLVVALASFAVLLIQACKQK